MARILGIGTATLDIINRVDGYPAEDSEVRALARRISRGGNCPNTLVVLSQLGLRCDWGGVLAEEPDAARITPDRDGELYHSPAFPPPRVVDTLGAGDTFNAGLIDARVRGLAVREALEQACRLAGRKCGQEGLYFSGRCT